MQMQSCLFLWSSKENYVFLKSGLSSWDLSLQFVSISIYDVLSANNLVYVHLLCLFVLMFYISICNFNHVGGISGLPGFYHY